MMSCIGPMEVEGGKLSNQVIRGAPDLYVRVVGNSNVPDYIAMNTCVVDED